MIRTQPLILAVLAICALPLFAAADAPEEGEKQPVFLLCPHSNKHSAWSIYLLVDTNDHHQILALGLESLQNQNSKDSSYEAVLAAQNDPKVNHEFIAKLEAKDFGSGQLDVKKDDALHITLAPEGDGFDLGISMRVSMGDRFVIGGKEKDKCDLILSYDDTEKRWVAKVKRLQDFAGANLDSVTGKIMTGIAFPVSGTGIYVVMGVFDNGEPVTLMDRSGH